MRDVTRDLVLAFRGLVATPLATLLSVALLALGLGATIAMLAAVDRLWLRPLPYPDAERLLAVYEVDGDGRRSGTSVPTLEDWAAAETGLSAIAGYRRRSFLLQPPAAPQAGFVDQLALATSELFRVLGVEPRHGRAFTRDEELAGARRIVLVDGAARRLFGTPAAALASAVRVNDVDHLVVGVMAPDFELWADGEVVAGLIPVDRASVGARRTVRSLAVIARTATDSDTAAARLAAVTRELGARHPDSMGGRRVAVESLHRAWRGANRAPLTLLAGAALLVLAAALANVGGLLLGRQLGRLGETGTRLALGASRWRLVRHQLAEGLAIGASGALAGLLFAAVLLRLLPVLLTTLSGLPAALRMASATPRIDATALPAAAALAVATGALLATFSWWATRRVSPADLLRPVAPAGGRDGVRDRALLAAQIGVTLVLGLAAVLLLRSFANLTATDPGFRPAEVARFGIGIPSARYPTEREQIEFHRRLAMRLEEIGGVERAGIAASLPPDGRAFETWFAPVGSDLQRDRRPRTRINVASPGWFEALGTRLVAGRLPSWRDGVDSPRVAVVNEIFARTWLDGRLPSADDRFLIGWRSAVNPPGSAWEIVGVVGDMRAAGLGAEAVPTLYLPASQYPLEGGSFVVRTTGDPLRSAEAIRAAVRSIDPGLQEIHVGTMAERLRDSLAPQRRALLTTAAFAAIAVLVTLVGVHAAVAVAAARRRHELAIRSAVGARPADLVRHLLSGALIAAAGGTVLGGAGFALVARLLERYLHDVTPLDPLSVAVTLAALSTVVVAAGLGPALRARRDPAADLGKSR